MEIDNSLSHNPTEFWERIKNLGPRKKSSIPWEVEVDGQILTKKDEVLEKWHSDFSKLFTTESSEFDNEFKDNVLRDFDIKAPNLFGLYRERNLNRKISEIEVRKAVEKSKNKKACGVGQHPQRITKK